MRGSVCSQVQCIENERQRNNSAVKQQPTGVSSLRLLSYWEALGNNVGTVSGRRVAVALIDRRASDLRIDETAAITSINHPIIAAAVILLLRSVVYFQTQQSRVSGSCQEILGMGSWWGPNWMHSNVLLRRHQRPAADSLLLLLFSH